MYVFEFYFRVFVSGNFILFVNYDIIGVNNVVLVYWKVIYVLGFYNFGVGFCFFKI